MALLEKIEESTANNGSFSKALLGLQTSVDSTSLGTFKVCPRKYLYSIVLGYRQSLESVHLTFGLALHRARETYEHAASLGMCHADALDSALAEALSGTWDYTLGKPWYSGHNLKDRFTLIRSIVWYLDEFGDNDPLETLILANGKPAIELSFSFDSGFKSYLTGEPFFICGHLDRIGKLGEHAFICDIKTTSTTIGPYHFQQWSPDNQMSTYALAGKVAFNVETSGIIIDAVQVAKGFTRVVRGTVSRTVEQCEDFLQQTGTWLRSMEACAEEANWPMNDKNCHQYGGCEFRKVCAAAPGAKHKILELEYVRKTWDPTVARGDA